MKTTKAFSRNKFTSALLVLAIGLNGCAMIQPAAMSGPCRDAATGRYTSCDTGPSGWDRLSSDDRLAVGLTLGVALAGLAAWGIYEIVSGPSRVTVGTPTLSQVQTVGTPTLSQVQCVLTAQQLSEHWNCETQRLFGQHISPSAPISVGQTVPTTTDGSVYAPTIQTTTGGPVYVHGYTRANGTYVAPYTRRR